MMCSLFSNRTYQHETADVFTALFKNKKTNTLRKCSLDSNSCIFCLCLLTDLLHNSENQTNH